MRVELVMRRYNALGEIKTQYLFLEWSIDVTIDVIKTRFAIINIVPTYLKVRNSIKKNNAEW